MVNLDQELALEEFLRGFSPPKSERFAKKQEEKIRENVKHSVSTGECKWKEKSCPT